MAKDFKNTKRVKLAKLVDPTKYANMKLEVKAFRKLKAAADSLEALQTALVEAQVWGLDQGKKLIVIFEGRDAAGKDGAIKRIMEYLSIRQTRMVALSKPTTAEQGQWWFQRYIAHLPTKGEWALFNRSWYNRAGVEKVMGFSTPEQQAQFIQDVPIFEKQLVDNQTIIIKFWLDISKPEQAKRLIERGSDPLKRLKRSDLDQYAQTRWDDYTNARNEMLQQTHTDFAPWICVKTNDKKTARENIIKHILNTLNCPEHTTPLSPCDEDVLFSYDAVKSGEVRLFE